LRAAADLSNFSKFGRTGPASADRSHFLVILHDPRAAAMAVPAKTTVAMAKSIHFESLALRAVAAVTALATAGAKRFHSHSRQKVKSLVG
jgi:hypothetical protein